MPPLSVSLLPPAEPPAGTPPPALSTKERRLLELLQAHADQVVPHRLVLWEVWGAAYDDASIYLLHALVRRLRRRLGDAPPGRIVAVAAIGYRWTADDGRRTTDH